MVRVVNSRRSHLKTRHIPSPYFLSLSFDPQNAGKTAAMLAASAGCAEILKVMNRGPSLLNLKDADGGTAAMSAAVHSHSSVLDYVSARSQPQSTLRNTHAAHFAFFPLQSKYCTV